MNDRDDDWDAKLGRDISSPISWTLDVGAVYAVVYKVGAYR